MCTCCSNEVAAEHYVFHRSYCQQLKATLEAMRRQFEGLPPGAGIYITTGKITWREKT
jgi:hypothetical protein